jgi:hypothetical protein
MADEITRERGPIELAEARDLRLHIESMARDLRQLADRFDGIAHGIPHASEGSYASAANRLHHLFATCFANMLMGRLSILAGNADAARATGS